jgi:hypothetical protein
MHSVNKEATKTSSPVSIGDDVVSVATTDAVFPFFCDRWFLDIDTMSGRVFW